MAKGFFHEQTACQVKPDRIVVAARFPADSDWFSGHFPGQPIVPGVALIAMAAEAVVEWERAKGRFLSVTGVRRVRFRQPVRPDEEVILEASPTPHPKGPAYAFNVLLAGENACSGVLTAENVLS